MQWVWVLPSLILFSVIDQTSPSLREDLARRFGAPCPFPVVSRRGLEALLCTAAAYSFGALLSRNWPFRTIDP
jgi:hypothetical protein